jgi:hypothetical protein
LKIQYHDDGVNGAQAPRQTSDQKTESIMHITIRYGLNSVTRDFPPGITVGQVLRDPNVKAGLGYSDNVKGLLNGVELPPDAILQPDTALVVEARVNAKA